VRLLLDEHIDPAVAPGLHCLRTVEVIALRDWEQGAFLHTDDQIILRAARTNGWTLVTFDRASISPLLKEWGSRGESHGGVIFVDERTFAQNDVGGLVRALVHLLDALGDVSWENRQAYLRH
jgi:hypothetical protein